MSAIVYGPKRRSVHSSWGSVPAVGRIRLSVRLNEIPDVVETRWSIDGTVIGTTLGRFGELSLKDYIGKRTISARCLMVGGGSVTVEKPMRLRLGTAEEEIYYAEGVVVEPPVVVPPVVPPVVTPPVVVPPTSPTENDPRLVGVGCRIPYLQLTRITPAEAALRPNKDVSGCLVLGPLPAGCIGTDVYVEAQTRVETLAGSCKLSYATITGMQRDAQGYPWKLHPIRQGLNGSNYQLDHADISWINDGWSNAQRGKITDSVIRDHLFFIYRGDVQHRDGIQPYGGGDLTIERVHFYNDTPQRPIGQNGLPIIDGWTPPSTGDQQVGPALASAGVMMNHDKPYSDGPVIINECHFYGGGSVSFNIAGGTDPGRANGEDWCMPVYDSAGKLILGLSMRDNIVESLPTNSANNGGVVRVTAPVYRTTILFPNAPSWGYSPTANVGPTTAVAVRKPDGGLRNVLRREVIF